MAKAQFGSHFEVDAANRLDPLKKEEAIPDYVHFAREEVRGALKLSGSESWPEFPKGVQSVEGLFSKVREAVDQRWLKKIVPILKAQYETWLSQIPDSEENREIRDSLSNSDQIEQGMEMRQFGFLSDLRDKLPEAWKMLVLASSERQLAEVELLRHWLRQVPPEEAQKWGMSKPELELFADIPAFLEKYIDHGYVKQMELADRPGGKSKTPMAGQVGADRIYDIRRKGSKEVQALPYISVFPFELGRFSKLVLHLKGKVEARLAQGQLPESYAGMPAYLGKIAELYSSHEVSPKKLAELWNTDLASDANRLAKAGCPMVLIPQSTAAVADDAEKVDIELRLGLRTPEIVATEKLYNEMGAIAQSMVNEYPGAVKEHSKVPPVNITYQPLAFGPNLYWMTRGESTGDRILSHPNSVAEVASRKEIPLLEKVFELGKVNVEDYCEAAKLETVLHELAHSVLSTDDEGLKKRVGSGQKSKIVEEIKADTVNMAILDRAIAQGGKFDAEKQFLAKLGTLCDYIVKSAGDESDEYGCVGLKSFHELLSSGAIEKAGDGKYAILDARKGIGVLAAVGDKILKDYADPETNPRKIARYASKVIALKDDPKLREFMETVNRK